MKSEKRSIKSYETHLLDIQEYTIKILLKPDNKVNNKKKVNYMNRTPYT